MSGNDRSKFLALAIENPKATNGVIALIGAAFLLAFAVLYVRKPAINVFGYFLVSSEGMAIIAVFLKEVGLAAVVAVLINFSIEAFNRKRHHQEKLDLISTIDDAHKSRQDAQIKAINQHMFQTVYERNIPHEFFKAIEEVMLRSNFLRRDSNYDIDIARFDEGYARIVVRHVCYVTNVSSASADYDLRLGFDVVKAKAEHYKIREFRLGDEVASSEELVPVITDKTEGHQWWDYTMRRSIPAGETRKCVFELVRLSPLVGKEAICTMVPTDRMAVRLFDRGGNFSVRAMSLHPRSEVIVHEGDGRHHWELDGALFPGQGFLIDWMPRQEGVALCGAEC